MTRYSMDVSYVCARLGLAPDAAFGEIQEILANAAAYRFSDRARIESIRRFVKFFHAREVFGTRDASFAEIRKAYHRKAMELHPDRNKDDKGSEERLKEINAAFALVDDINRQARQYYRQSEEVRRESEREAREAAERERPEGGKKTRAREQPEPPKREESPAAAPDFGDRNRYRPHSFAKKYMAASVPRSIRTARLGYLPLHTIIGSRAIRKDNDISFILDIIMLPEDQFLRARSYLAAPETALPALQYGKFAPPYILKDMKEIVVPPGEADPENFAREYFRKEFGI